MPISTQLRNEFLRAYLQYVDSTESPQIMHAWSAVCNAAACMGRHIWLPFGFGDLFANQFILLVGPPGTRKSTAIKYANRLVKEATTLRYAPDDTAGQRQGLISAITDAADLISAEDKAMIESAELLSVEDLANIEIKHNPHEDHNTIFILALEFGSFLGQNNLDLTRFLIKMWDGDNYKYGLKNQQLELIDPLATMAGATTSTEIATLLPPEAMGQGFMSRLILVYAGKREKKVPPDEVWLDPEIKPMLVDTFKWLNEEMAGPMSFTEEGRELSNSVYGEPIDIPDNRFLYYAERRHTHLMKLAMVLAACRRSYKINAQDIQEAHALLTETESVMPDALGEYGLSPLATAKQKMVEFLIHAGQPVTDRVLWSFMSRDMKLIDFRNSLATLVAANKINKVPTTMGDAYVYREQNQEILDLLAEDSDDSEVIQLGVKT